MRDSWIEPGAGFGTLTMHNDRGLSQTQNCQPVSGGANYALSRGWNYNQVSFDVNNPHGDAQHFGFWVTHYADGVGNCSRLSGFRLNNWTFPYGVTVSVDYDATTQSA